MFGKEHIVCVLCKHLILSVVIRSSRIAYARFPNGEAKTERQRHAS
jgi:hypothetical protein